MQCKICLKPVYPLTKAKILNKYWVDYFRCDSCGFIFTEEPYWLAEAYSEAINKSDLGLVDRNIRLSYALMPLLKMAFKSGGRFVDYGGGYGLLVRIMRDRGYDFYRFDQYCENIFAKGFDITESDANGQFEMITAIEVFEHLVDPEVEIRKMMAFSKNIFFATELLPSSKEMPGQWSYYGLEHGQHISLFTKKSLKILAEKLGLYFSTDGRGLHLFSETKKPQLLFGTLTSYRVGKYLTPFLRRPSLLQNDYFKVTGHEL